MEEAIEEFKKVSKELVSNHYKFRNEMIKIKLALKKRKKIKLNLN